MCEYCNRKLHPPVRLAQWLLWFVLIQVWWWMQPWIWFPYLEPVGQYWQIYSCLHNCCWYSCQSNLDNKQCVRMFQSKINKKPAYSYWTQDLPKKENRENRTRPKWDLIVILAFKMFCWKKRLPTNLHLYNVQNGLVTNLFLMFIHRTCWEHNECANCNTNDTLRVQL